MPQSGSTWIHNIVLNIFYINKINPYVSLFTTEKILDFKAQLSDEEIKFIEENHKKSLYIL